MKLVYLTSGAAGMYCGSCMHDNTLARGLTRDGVDVLLTPTYTPIRTDEQDVSIDRVFFGGISVFLQQKIPLFRYAPAFVDRFLDQPWLIRMATARASDTSPKELGALTVSMLKGKMGRQRKEVLKLCRWLEQESRPDGLLLSNMLIAGCVPTIKDSLRVPVVVTLQGDDIFLESLPEPFKQQALEELKRLAPSIDGFLAHSDYYADYMSDYLSIPRERIEVTPLGIDAEEFAEVKRAEDEQNRMPTIGYLARLAPEKGLHNLIDGFIQLHRELGFKQARLLIAGWLGDHNKSYVDEQFARLVEAGLGEQYEYLGAVDHTQKVEFLGRLDVLSVPTDYHEPKGLFVLESLAAGVPVVQPNHGAFPEVLNRVGGGKLFEPGDNLQLAKQIASLLADDAGRRQIGAEARNAVQERHNAAAMSRQTRELMERHIRNFAAGM